MSLTPDQVRTFDTLRARLQQLLDTLNSISRNLINRDPLPSWPQLESLQSSLSFALGQINDTMTLNATTLKEAHVYPLPNFPGHKEGDTLITLLRKKLDTVGEEWVEDFSAEKRKGFTDDRLNRTEIDGLWNWASTCSQGIVGPMLENEDFGDDFTLAEREEGVENVRTGLKRKLWEEESGDEDEDEKMGEDEMPARTREKEDGVDPELRPLPLEGVLRFVTTGAMPARPNR